MVQCVYAPEKSVKHFTFINYNPNKIQSLNLSPNQHVYEEDCSTLPDNVLITSS